MKKSWGLLLIVSAVVTVGLELLGLPAALLLGPMASGIAIASTGGKLKIPMAPLLGAQGIIGVMIAQSIPLSVLGFIVKDWPILLASVFAVIAVSGALGWLLARLRILPGTTAIWGSSPGAALAMTLMAEAYGADVRLVAFMQYLRVVCVALAASLVSRLWVEGSAVAAVEVDWFPPLSWLPLLETLVIGIGGPFLAKVLRVPAGPLLLPLAFGIALPGMGLMTIELPPWLLAICYALIGWSIGLRFTKPILVYAARAFPRILASTLTLIAICGGFAWILVQVAGVDPLTAYLATSPGGADSIAIIAASSKVDMSFVMALQTSRFLIVMMTGPALAKFLADRATAKG